MKPTTKTALIIVGSMAMVFVVPGVIVLLHDYLYAIIAISSFLACIAITGYCGYQELLPVIRQQEIEEQQVFHRFHGDKDKMRRYHGFKKHFDGELNLEQLEQWFLHLDRHH